ncbi:MAG: hypothetical protein ACYTGH_05925 [Planctomycetota bacterium]
MVGPDLSVPNWDAFLQHIQKRKRPLRIEYKAPRAAAYLILKAALHDSGISYGTREVNESGAPVQVVLVNLQKGSSMIPSLAGGLVDGIVMNQPVIAFAEAKKVGRVVCDLRDLPPRGHGGPSPASRGSSTSTPFAHTRQPAGVTDPPCPIYARLTGGSL